MQAKRYAKTRALIHARRAHRGVGLRADAPCIERSATRQTHLEILRREHAVIPGQFKASAGQ
jgi:hypothetical protein